MSDERVTEDRDDFEEDEWGQAAPAPPDPAAPPGPPAGTDAASAGRGRRLAAILGGVAVVALALGGYWWLIRDEAPTEPAPVAETAPPPVPSLEEERPDLPPLDTSDPFLRALLAALTDHPDALAWLLSDDLARRIAVAVENVAEGVTPRRALAGLAPAGSFRAAGEGEARQVHPAAFARYDPLAAAISGADIPGLARSIREAMPLMELAYAELGRPDRTFSDALLAALDRLVAVPVPETPILLDEATLRFEYRDPTLEGLDEASKHLLRFGPDNQRSVQEALGRLAALLRAPSPA